VLAFPVAVEKRVVDALRAGQVGIAVDLTDAGTLLVGNELTLT